MGALKKLNQAYFNGALLIATMVGIATQSWALFWIVAILVVASSIQSGNIRLKGRRSK